jgi:hypothetical protein
MTLADSAGHKLSFLFIGEEQVPSFHRNNDTAVVCSMQSRNNQKSKRKPEHCTSHEKWPNTHNCTAQVDFNQERWTGNNK